MKKYITFEYSSFYRTHSRCICSKH